MSDFNKAFNTILRKQQAKERKKMTKPSTLTTGDTEAGRRGMQALSTDDASVSRDHASYNIREYKQNPGATKGRGRLGGIRR